MSHEKDATVQDSCASPGLIPVDEAVSRILDAATSVQQSEQVRVADSLGRVIAEDVASTIDVPGYDNSAMDGYAVRSGECAAAGTSLAVSQRIPAGQSGVPLEAGTAARIFTGAPVPEGADAVVMQELCERQGESVVINKAVQAGENIRRAGEDIARGSVILAAGKRVRPQEQGLMASIGLASVRVSRKLRVATFFTGDELVDLGIVPDDLDATLDVLKRASADADLVLTSGGVSVGEEDYVRIALEQLGELNMWRINMKPGKPVAFGQVDEALFMGLPGNPVSVFVTFTIFARPLILKMQGAGNYLAEPLSIRSGFDWRGVKRQEYLRVRVRHDEAGVYAELFPHQGSGVLSSASWADGLAVVEPGAGTQAGDILPYIPFQGL